MAANSIQVEYRNISDLKPFSNLTRLHPRRQRLKLKENLRRLGLPTPILIEPDGTIIDGHLVAEMWGELGYEQIPVIVIANRDPVEIRAMRLALNRSPLDARWNEPALKVELEFINSVGFDLSLTFFDQVEIDMALDIDELSAGEVEDVSPTPIPSAPAVTVRDDIWQLGRHRLICGDSRDREVMHSLMAGAEAQMCFTDPPYNLAVSSISGLGKIQHREFGMASGEMVTEEFIMFLVAFLAVVKGVLVDGALIYACMDWRHQLELLTAAQQLELRQLNLCVWTKSNPGMGSFYRSSHELVHIFKVGTAPHRNNFELGQKGRSRSNVWAYRGMNVPGKERDELLAIHPTCKPVALVADAIKDVTDHGDLVLDPFIGSGTTIIAAERTGRRCFGIELDPLYVDAAVRRWQDYTGGKAVLDGTSATFEEVEAQRPPPSPLLLPPPAGQQSSGEA